MEDLKKMDKVIKQLQETAHQTLRYEPLDMEKAEIIVFSDESHATNADLSSQLGYMLFLTDGKNWHLLKYKSYKSRRTVRSPLAAETHALADAADMVVLVQHDLERLHRRKISITLLTDAKSLFDVIAKGTIMFEKRLMIDVRSTREAYEREVIRELGWMRREYNVSDALTKIETNHVMREFMETGKVAYKVERYVFRTPGTK